jgi:hypothetical protein
MKKGAVSVVLFKGHNLGTSFVLGVRKLQKVESPWIRSKICKSKQNVCWRTWWILSPNFNKMIDVVDIRWKKSNGQWIIYIYIRNDQEI